MTPATPKHPSNNKPQTIVALDVGERRIGVAIASAETRLPVAFTTISVNDDTIKTIMDVLDKQQAEELVIGLPRNLEGNETLQTKSVRKFTDDLKSAGCKVPIVWQDEAVTSIRAEEFLKIHGKPYRKEDIDAHAAMIILEDYLENKK